MRTLAVPNTDAETLVPQVCVNVETGARVYTDAHPSYVSLWQRFVHQWIDHATAYVADRVHTNGLENFWSLLKRGIRGTYIHVAAFHLDRYLDEQTFRFNAREGTDASRFRAVMECVVGRRLTYRRLCMIEGCGFMGLE